MTALDAETYLRCRLEDALVAGTGSGQQELAQRVRAALAIAAIDQTMAESVLADATRAFRLRSDGDRYEYDDPDEDPPGPPRVVACPTIIEQDWGTLVITHVVFGPSETTIGVHGVLRAPPTPRRPHRHVEPWQTVEVVDAAGTTHHTHFSGGSSDTTFDGQYGVHPGIDPASTAVTIAGHRIDLAATAAPPAVHVESLTGVSKSELARRHLELMSTHHRPWEGGEARIARDTFTDLGLVDVDEPVETEPGPARMRPARNRGSRSRGDTTSSRWLAVGATTPRVDGLVITVTTLADDGRVSILGSSHGHINGDGHWHLPPIRLTAVDDLGGRYAGEWGESGCGGGSFHGTQRLEPAIDADATTLTIVIDTLCHRILIDVPLEWRAAR